MSYIGAEPTTATFPFDQFSGNGTTTAFTLTYAPASPTSIIVSISGVVQNPNTYSVIGTTINFSPAPPTGTNNIAVLYLGLPVIGVSSPGNTAYLSTTDFTATAGQTTFTPSGSYQVGFVQVFRNGSRLGNADYTATNGTTVVLNNACVAGDLVSIQVYTLTSISNALPLTGGTVTGASTFNSTLSVNGAFVSGFTGFKNRIINGGMVIAQRGTNFVSPTDAYTLDRWEVREDTDGAVTVTQETDAPVGFINSLKVTTTTADASLAATQRLQINQRIEGFNIADLAWGTASAAPITLSFRVKSSLTGTFGASLANNGTAWSYPFTYTINSANTWEDKTVTIPGAPSGTWLTNNGLGLFVRFGLGVGSTYSGTAGAWQNADYISTTGAVSVIGTLNATWQITGVQLERGSNATSFEFRSIGQELSLCQRYYEVLTQNTGNYAVIGLFRGASDYRSTWWFKVDKRATPTWSLVGATTWAGATPTGYPAIGYIDYTAGVSFYTGNPTVGTPVLQAVAEL